MKNKENGRRKKIRNKNYIFLLILCMGIGFALLSTQIQINGMTTLIGSTWDVYLSNVQVIGENAQVITPPTIDENKTKLAFEIKLNQPGDFYEFTVNAVNNGTVDAMISDVTLTEMDESISNYLLYNISYLDGTTIKDDDIISAKDSVTYKIRIEFKKNITISELSENAININLSFSIDYTTVNASIDRTFPAMAKKSAADDSFINFNKNSFYTNGNGLFVVNSTKENDYPIYYYRGEVNNNVLFAGYCWKIVRSTETGGTKLIYNGPQSYTYSETNRLEEANYNILSNIEEYPFTFDEESMSYISTSNKSIELTDATIEFSVLEAGDYFLNLNIPTQTETMSIKVYKDGNYLTYLTYSIDDKKVVELYGLTTESVITIKYSKSGGGSQYSQDKLSFSLDKGIEGVLDCDNKGDRTVIGYSPYNENTNSLAYVGYMYGNTYPVSSITREEQEIIRATSYTYSNGTYTLTDTTNSTEVSELNEYHYTCYNSQTSCNTLYYVYKIEENEEYYIELTDGKTIEEAIAEMMTNTTNSSLKNTVDNWFQNNIVSYFNNLDKNYKKYIEDTVWCNDRSINTIGAEEYTANGWIENGNIGNNLYYSSLGRRMNGAPTLTCSNKNDSFTVKESASGNGKLTYPVGFLTVDEIVLAGGQNARNDYYYLNSDSNWWTMSPRGFHNSVDIHYVDNYGAVSSNVYSTGVRPVISIAPGVKIRKTGTGTVSNPYQFILK